MAVALRPFKPELARQARAALVMDTTDLVFDATALHEEFPTLPSTTLADLLAARGDNTSLDTRGAVEIDGRIPDINVSVSSQTTKGNRA